MRILLLGEYSRLHTLLKSGLEELGHEVLVVGTGDGFKQLEADITLKNKYKKGFSLVFNKILFKLFKIDLNSWNIQKQFFKHQEKFIDYDAVQLINTSPFGIQPKTEKKLLQFIFSRNKNCYLLSCGADYFSVTNGLERKARYSILDPYLEDSSLKKHYLPILRYVTTSYVQLHHFVVENCKGIIASDLDYHLPLLEHPKYLGMVPNPIVLDILPYLPPKMDGKIRIFHGINRRNYHKKGTSFFEEALHIIQERYPEKVVIQTVEDVPYKTYISLFDEAHIVLDQVYAYDQGFNALEAMAKGKVVFTGAEQEWLEFYKIAKDTVAINALPNVTQIVEKLADLIENPEKIIAISKAARSFVEREHNHIAAANSYLSKWKSKMLGV